MRFEFASPTRIVFGSGTRHDASAAVRGFGRRAAVVMGRNRARAADLLQQLTAAGIGCTVLTVPGEPTTDLVTELANTARAADCDVVVGFGGGSVIDAAKAVSALLTNQGDLHDYLEIIGAAKPLSVPAAPCIAIPTTAGTGAEVTRNAVLASPAHRVKASLRSAHMLPRIAIVDPELTLDLPRNLTASTGLDALTQLLEAFVTPRATPLTTLLCRDGLVRASRALRQAVANGHDRAARTDMALASLYGGLALANAGLGAVHGFAAPIGGMFPAPHGAVCAALLPHVVEINLRAIRERGHEHAALGRFQELAVLLTGRATAGAEEAVPWLQSLVAELGIPSLRQHQVSERDIPAIAAAAEKASSMKANPIVLTPSELEEVLRRAL